MYLNNCKKKYNLLSPFAPHLPIKTSCGEVGGGGIWMMVKEKQNKHTNKL